MNTFFVWGTDFGKTRDYTAVAIVEVQPTWRTFGIGEVPDLPIKSLVCRKVDRFPLKVSYETIGRTIEQRVRAEEKKGHESFVIADNTGVGRAASEQLKYPIPLLVSFSSGNRVTPGDCGNELNVPKVDIVASLQVAIETGLLKILDEKDPRMGSITDIFTNELHSFVARSSDSGRESYNAAPGFHDDIVVAFALACWGANHIVQLKCRNAVAEIEQRMLALRLRGLTSDDSISSI